MAKKFGRGEAKYFYTRCKITSPKRNSWLLDIFCFQISIDKKSPANLVRAISKDDVSLQGAADSVYKVHAIHDRRLEQTILHRYRDAPHSQCSLWCSCRPVFLLCERAEEVILSSECITIVLFLKTDEYPDRNKETSFSLVAFIPIKRIYTSTHLEVNWETEYM